MPRENEHEFICMVLQNNVDAIRFCKTVFKISQVIDDLVDRDKSVDNRTIMETFWQCLVDLPNDPFYNRHFHFLNPLIQTFFNDWMDSCILEAGDDHYKSIAFVLRDSIGGLVIQCAYLVGGYQWMRKISVDVRDHIFEENFSSYKGGLS